MIAWERLKSLTAGLRHCVPPALLCHRTFTVFEWRSLQWHRDYNIMVCRPLERTWLAHLLEKKNEEFTYKAFRWSVEVLGHIVGRHLLTLASETSHAPSDLSLLQHRRETVWNKVTCVIEESFWEQCTMQHRIYCYKINNHCNWLW